MDQKWIRLKRESVRTRTGTKATTTPRATDYTTPSIIYSAKRSTNWVISDTELNLGLHRSSSSNHMKLCKTLQNLKRWIRTVLQSPNSQWHKLQIQLEVKTQIFFSQISDTFLQHRKRTKANLVRNKCKNFQSKNQTFKIPSFCSLGRIWTHNTLESQSSAVSEFGHEGLFVFIVSPMYFFSITFYRTIWCWITTFFYIKLFATIPACFLYGIFIKRIRIWRNSFFFSN